MFLETLEMHQCLYTEIHRNITKNFDPYAAEKIIFEYSHSRNPKTGPKS